MKIIELSASNVMRLKAVTIKPDGPVVQITGENAQGKSSVLNAIAIALGGKKWEAQETLRRGEKKGTIVCKLDNGLTVTQNITESGSNLIVSNTSDGARHQSPRSLLDKLYGDLTFDPLAFTRMNEKDQLATLKRLAGVDFTDLDAKRFNAYSQRTEVNRALKQVEATLATITTYPDAPEAPVNVAELLEQLTQAQTVNSNREAHQRSINDAKEAARQSAVRLSQLEANRQELERSIDRERAAAEDHKRRAAELEAAIPAGVEEPPIRQAIASADQTNRMVESNRTAAKVQRDLEGVTKRAAAFTKEIEEVDAAKAKAIADAKLPVDGLTFTDAGVMYNAIPFSQASSAEQLRVSVAMGLAMNPQLRILLIRDGSLLDSHNLQTIADMAQAADAQVWIERVDESGEVGIVIEDGQVAATNQNTEGTPTDGR